MSMLRETSMEDNSRASSPRSRSPNKLVTAPVRPPYSLERQESHLSVIMQKFLLRLQIGRIRTMSHRRWQSLSSKGP
jgi:hypothetical protein